MSTEYAPLRPPDPPRAGGSVGLPGKLDDSLLHSELVTQRNRAVTYAVAGAAMLLTRAVGLYDVHYIWTVAIFGLGLLSVGCFSLLALRAQRANRRACSPGERSCAWGDAGNQPSISSSERRARTAASACASGRCAVVA